MDKGNWTYRKLEEVAEIINGKNQKSVETVNGKYPICGSGGVMGYASEYLCPENTIIIGRKGNINNPIFMKEKFWNVDTAFGIVANDSVNPKFLFYFCKDYDFEKHNVAVTIPSLRKMDLLEISVPIPPLEIQSRIVAELDCISSILEKKRQQLKELDNLAQAIFYDMFGDPVENEKGWEVKKLGEIGELSRGVSKHRPRNAPELLGGTMPLIQTGDVSNSGMYITEYNSTYSDIGVKQSRVWQKGTLCITIAANIGKCSILTFEACFPDSVVGFIPFEYACVEYMYFVFGAIQKMLENNAMGVAQKNINLGILNQLSLALPPLSLQQSFAAKIEAIEKQKERISQSIKEVQTLFDSRMQEYFG